MNGGDIFETGEENGAGERFLFSSPPSSNIGKKNSASTSTSPGVSDCVFLKLGEEGKVSKFDLRDVRGRRRTSGRSPQEPSPGVEASEIFVSLTATLVG